MEANKSVENFVPLQDWVLVEELPPSQTPGGIALPDGAKTEEFDLGRVVAAGPGRYTETGELIPIDVEKGDIVYMFFAYQKPVKLVLGGKKHALTRSRDLVAKRDGEFL